MATATPTRVEPGDPGRQIVLHDVSWERYEILLSEFGDRRIRLTYDRGELEIMSPSPEHELQKKRLGRLLEVLTLELNIPIQSLGSTTFRRRDVVGGLEPDECYYIRNEPLVRGRRNLDLATDPPPDLAIEIDITHSSLDRQKIYAALKIPELWRFDGETLEVSQLEPDGNYTPQCSSPSFPFLPLPELQRFLNLADTTDETRWIRSFRDWVRATLAPGMPERE